VGQLKIDGIKAINAEALDKELRAALGDVTDGFA
jgi:hypothetical protein